MKPQFRRTIMLGLGGTGSKILLQIKRQLLATCERIPYCVSFLAMDTDRLGSMSIHASSDTSCELHATESLHLEVTNPADVLDKMESVRDWFVGDPPGAIVSGTGAVRQNGRLAFVANTHLIHSRLDRLISDLNDVRIHTRLDAQGFALSKHNVEVFIFCSLAGGTGGAMLLDLGRFVRNMMPDASVHAICLSSWPCRNTAFGFRVHGNAQATLDELDAAQQTEATLNQSDLEAVGIYDASIAVRVWPFSGLTIIDGRNELGAQMPSLESLCVTVAAAATLLIGPFLPPLETHAEGSLPQERFWDSSGYSTLGVAAIYYPAHELHTIQVLSRSLRLCNEAICAEDAHARVAAVPLDPQQQTDGTITSLATQPSALMTVLGRLMTARALIEKKLSDANDKLRVILDDLIQDVLENGRKPIVADCGESEWADFSGRFFADNHPAGFATWPENPEDCAQLLIEFCSSSSAGVRDVTVMKAIDTLAAAHEAEAGGASAYLEKLYQDLFRRSAVLVRRGQVDMTRSGRTLEKRTLYLGFGSENDATDLHRRAIGNAMLVSGTPDGRQVYCVTGDPYRIWLLAVERGLPSISFSAQGPTASFERELEKAMPPFYCRPLARRDRHEIFISYRRDGGEHLAARVKEALKARKFSVFMDVEDLKYGRFDEALLKKIEEATDVIVILTPGCLERCKNVDDWLRREIGHAIRSKRNVVPVMARYFEMPPPETLPSDIADLPLYNGLPPAHEMFDQSMDRLVSTFLKSKSRRH